MTDRLTDPECAAPAPTAAVLQLRYDFSRNEVALRRHVYSAPTGQQQGGGRIFNIGLHPPSRLLPSFIWKLSFRIGRGEMRERVEAANPVLLLAKILCARIMNGCSVP